MYYAHSAPSRKDWEPLSHHLTDVAERAASFASAFGAAEEARLAGLLHDLGKYSDRFTLRLEGKARGLDHWSSGASAAVARFGLAGAAAGLAVQGHHVGLQSLGSLAGLGNLARFAANLPTGSSLTETDLTVLLSYLEADGLVLPKIDRSIFNRDAPRGGGMLDVRMLFSALVDADFLETEAHFARDSQGRKVYRPAGPALRPREALDALDAHLASLARKSPANAAVKALRADLLNVCREAGAWPQGLFTLSAPTGAGKTLAMLAFALRHAAEHGLDRIVVAVPFLSIIEQTVKVYRGLFAPIFGDHYVLEHHSLAGTRGTVAGERDGQSEAERTARLLTENWDAPLVVTTSVQILESLFANRPKACRKLHRLANSVILLDEVQTLPPRLAAPTLATLSHLHNRYGASVVFATATQPAFEDLNDRVKPLAGVTDILLKSRGPEGMDLQCPELFDAYYKTLYGLTGIKERDEGKAKKLGKAIQDLDFATTAELYRLIEQDAINVLVPYDPEEFESLRDEPRRTGRLTTGWIQRARPHTVNVYRPKDDDPIRAFLEPAPPVRDGKAREEMKAGDWFVLLQEGLYDREMLGLTGAPSVWIA